MTFFLKKVEKRKRGKEEKAEINNKFTLQNNKVIYLEDKNRLFFYISVTTMK